MNNGDTTQNTTQTTLGRYRLLQRIGRGGMGEVWLGEDPRLHRQVAIKTLPSHNRSDKEYLQRFEREARAAAALNHPHILPVHDFGEQVFPNGQAVTYIVMPYLPGGSLEDHLGALANTGTLLPPREALSMLAQAAEAIDYAHTQGILHRDIKPGNMLLREDGWLMLADFGIARILSDTDSLTQTGLGFGTSEYMAPEQAQGNAIPASDAYSLAVIAYRLFTGRFPFKAETSYATTIQHLTMPPPPPRQFNPALSAATEQALLHGLAKSPEQRPSSARAFAAELQQATGIAPSEANFIHPLSAGAALPPSAGANAGTPKTEPGSLIAPLPQTGQIPAPPPAFSRRKVLTGGAALLALGLGAGAWAFISHEQQGKPPQRNTTGRPNPNDPAMTLLSHTRPVCSLVWSPQADTLLLASAGQDLEVMLWDILAIQKGLASQKAPHTQISIGSGPDMQLAYSPGGKYLAIGNARSDSSLNSITLVYSGDLRTTLSTKLVFQSFESLTWTPGRYLAIFSSDIATLDKYPLTLWNPEQPSVTPKAFSFSDVPSAPVFSPISSLLAIAFPNGILVGQVGIAGTTTTWKQVSHDLKAEVIGSLGADRVTWSPDETYIAALSTSISPAGIAIWDWRKNQLVSSPNLPNPDIALTTLAWSPAPASSLMAAGTKDGSVLVWNIDRNAVVSGGNLLPYRVLNGLQAEVFSLAWSPDGQWLAASYKDINSSILLWRLI